MRKQHRLREQLTPEAVQSRGRMEMTWHARSQVDILADALLLGCLVKVRRADCLSHDIPGENIVSAY